SRRSVTTGPRMGEVSRGRVARHARHARGVAYSRVNPTASLPYKSWKTFFHLYAHGAHGAQPPRLRWRPLRAWRAWRPHARHARASALQPGFARIAGSRPRDGRHADRRRTADVSIRAQSGG